jgi:hypothetical protein
MDLQTLGQRLACDFYKWDGYTDREARMSPQPFLLSERQGEELTTIVRFPSIHPAHEGIAPDGGMSTPTLDVR